MTINVIIADDHPVVRAGLRAVLESAPDITVLAEVGDPDDAVAKCTAEAGTDPLPDVVLMDLRFGEGPGSAGAADGVTATEKIRSLPGAPQVLVITNYSTDADILGAVSAGAVGYLLKDSGPDELIAGVRDASRGRTVLSQKIAGRLMGRLSQPAVELTAREVEVLELVAAGHSNRKIASQLVLTEATVKSHLVHIFTKLDVTSRTEAVAVSRERGILGG
ncbi:LuxR C-terminal-related transcriptional regulator [Corynebacterium sputi]|uniref:LuxR C-terminal-related transcriptional regulator n=1 Tax=Corynebacterium sputi TaxID=489915 RepID=UPI0004277C3B|nr:response regulator transcription factor [Corynebacterium sputi]